VERFLRIHARLEGVHGKAAATAYNIEWEFASPGSGDSSFPVASRRRRCALHLKIKIILIQPAVPQRFLW
jgi:hypothetical protein